MIHLSWKQRRKKFMRKEKDTEKCVTTNLYFKSWVKKGIGERESRAVCNSSTSIIKKDGQNRRHTLGRTQKKSLITRSEAVSQARQIEFVAHLLFFAKRLLSIGLSCSSKKNLFQWFVLIWWTMGAEITKDFNNMH